MTDGWHVKVKVFVAVEASAQLSSSVFASCAACLRRRGEKKETGRHGCRCADGDAKRKQLDMEGRSHQWTAFCCTASVDFNVSCKFGCVWSKNEFQVSAPGGTLAESTPFEHMITARGLTVLAVALNVREFVNNIVFHGVLTSRRQGCGDTTRGD